jgi:hypothetical protein
MCSMGLELGWDYSARAEAETGAVFVFIKDLGTRLDLGLGLGLGPSAGSHYRPLMLSLERERASKRDCQDKQMRCLVNHLIRLTMLLLLTMWTVDSPILERTVNTAPSLCSNRSEQSPLVMPCTKPYGWHWHYIQYVVTEL